MTSTLQFTAGAEPIPSYCLIKQIGTGGCGEVWLADASGGLHKAIKLVYGSVMLDRAASELRSLQRLRQVHHPFILSIERIEIIDSHLVIVTELAECSLYDRFCECRRHGLKGIPRAKLLRYLRDAAEALDFLSTQHDLQHLDIKPGNLLLIADRVKVADFGMVKDLQDKNASLIGGLTPTYAAPEMFDGKPGRYSDQYSLAVMYQELLTGELPFSGTTLAQLATQHTCHAPSLEALPTAEQAIVARALSKDPGERFPSCIEFVDALTGSSEKSERDETPRSARRFVARSSPSFSSGGSADSRRSIPNPDSTKVFATREMRDVAAPKMEFDSAITNHPCFFIGLGRTGNQIIRHLRHRFESLQIPLANTQWLLMDTDQAGLREEREITSGDIDLSDLLYVPLRNANHYREQPAEKFESVSRRWLFNLPRSSSTEGIRPIGQVALLDHQHQIADALRLRFEKLAASTPDAPASPKNTQAPRVYIVASTHGGTGSSWICDIAFAIRNLSQSVGLDRAQTFGVLLSAICGTSRQEQLAAASSIACLSELAGYMNGENRYSGLSDIVFEGSESTDDLFRSVYLLNNTRWGDNSQWHQLVEQTSQFLLWDARTPVGLLLDKIRSEPPQAEHSTTSSWLRTFNLVDYNLPSAGSPVHVQPFLEQALDRWNDVESVADIDSFESETEVISWTNRDESLKKEELELQRILKRLLPSLQLDATTWIEGCKAQLPGPPWLLDSSQRNSFVSQTSNLLARQIIKNCLCFAESSEFPRAMSLMLPKALEEHLHLLQEQLLTLQQSFRVASGEIPSPDLHTLPETPSLDSEEASDADFLPITLEVVAATQLRVAEQVCGLKERLANIKRFLGAFIPRTPGQRNQELPVPQPESLESIRRWRELVSRFSRKLIDREAFDFLGRSLDTQEEARKHHNDRLVNLETLLSRLAHFALEAARELGVTEYVLESPFTSNQLREMHQKMTALAPSLPEFNGSRRLIAPVSVDRTSPFEESVDKWRRMCLTTDLRAFAPVPVCSETSGLLSEIGDLELHEIATRLWGNSEGLKDLANRLTVRNDTAWRNILEVPGA